MSKKVYAPAQIVKKLSQIERLIAGGKLAAAACKRAGVTEQVYRRWRKDYGALAKRLTALRPALKARDRDLAESLEQQNAISEILRVISASPTNIMPVLKVVAENAMRLCQSRDARIWLVDGEKIKYVTGCGSISPANVGDTMPLNRQSGPGRAILDRKPVHIADAATVSEKEFPVVREMQRLHGHRTLLNVPLLREHQALGSIVLRRMVVQPFTERQIALVHTFAAQAVIAIENVRLFNETKEALEQQTATSEVSKAAAARPLIFNRCWKHSLKTPRGFAALIGVSS